MQILHKSTSVLHYRSDNIFKYLTFTLIGDNEENSFCCSLDETKWAGNSNE